MNSLTSVSDFDAAILSLVTRSMTSPDRLSAYVISSDEGSCFGKTRGNIDCFPAGSEYSCFFWLFGYVGEKTRKCLNINFLILYIFKVPYVNRKNGARIE